MAGGSVTVADGVKVSVLDGVAVGVLLGVDVGVWEDVTVAVGVRVFLTIPTFEPLEAIVAWRGRTTFGCRFLLPLHPAVFATIAARFA